jgi:hypothetical protein
MKQGINRKHTTSNPSHHLPPDETVLSGRMPEGAQVPQHGWGLGVRGLVERAGSGEKDHVGNKGAGV